MPKTVQITPDVRAVLIDSTIEGPASSPRLKLPERPLDRPLYESVDKVLKALGGKWDRRSRAHIFARPLDGDLAEILARDSVTDQKRTLEQFFTPREIAERVCDLAGDLDGTDVLEPSAGAGAIALEAFRRGASVTAVEIDPRLSTGLCSESEGRINTICANFIGWRPAPPYTPAQFDAVLMNPPFCRGLDLVHVWQAFEWVRPGGVLVSIMSPRWTFAEDRAGREFREAVRRHDHCWSTLPDGTFRQEGTLVATGILTIHKEK